MRCAWPGDNPLLLDYHDHVWGRPCHRDRPLFEDLCLEILSTGLSWRVVLSKKQELEEAFHGFDPASVARLGPKEERLLSQDRRAIRHPAKIHALVVDARCVVGIEERAASSDGDGLPDGFSRWLWNLAGNRTHAERGLRTSALSDRICQAMREQGFSYAGPVTVHSFLQACGVINSHDPGCAFFCGHRPDRSDRQAIPPVEKES